MPNLLTLSEAAEEIKRLTEEARFYRSRCVALEMWQSRMRDPERTIVCDILANGHTLPDEYAGDRYKVKSQDA